MFSSGLPSTAIRSASRPASILPRSGVPNSSAFTIVALRIACSGVSPWLTRAVNSCALSPCGNTPASVPKATLSPYLQRALEALDRERLEVGLLRRERRRQLGGLQRVDEVHVRDDEAAVLLDDRRRFVRHHRVVLDAVDARLARGDDALGAVRVRRDLEAVPMRLVRRRAQLLERVLLRARPGPSNDSTPAVAQILMTLAPCLIW